MSVARVVVAGLQGAWRAPSVLMNTLPSLLSGNACAPATPTVDPRDARRASRVALSAVARLARLQPARWRSTCLYRSVAECLALRALGLPARVVIGVGTGANPSHTIAHAWVECAGIECLASRGDAELEAMTPRTA